MTKPLLMQLSLCHTEKEKYHPPHLFLRLGGGGGVGNIIMWAQKSQNSVAVNTVPVTVVPCMVSHEPVF